jgi:hypothetical protein
MALLADGVGLAHPGRELRVDFRQGRDPERVQVIPRRERLDQPEPGVLEAPGQDNVPVDPAAARRHLREGHADLERDPRLLGDDPNRADRGDGLDNAIEQRTDCGRLSSEMVLEIVHAAGV